MSHELPAYELLQQQAEWTAPLRSRLLRAAQIARRRHVLDLGAGYGIVSRELARRAGGPVVSFDCSLAGLQRNQCEKSADVADAGVPICGNAKQLPFPAESFDCVYCQFALLWMPLAETLREIERVLIPGGLLLAIEPDYEGLIEHPRETALRELWCAGLTRAGADPSVGRKLPGLLEELGLRVRVELVQELLPAAAARTDYLRDLPLTAAEKCELQRIESLLTGHHSPWESLAHLPLFAIMAVKPSANKVDQNP